MPCEGRIVHVRGRWIGNVGGGGPGDRLPGSVDDPAVLEGVVAILIVALAGTYPA